MANGDHLPIVFEDYPPYEFVEEGEVKGMNLDIIREAFKRMGIKAYFEPRPWKRAIYQLKTGEILALSSGFKTKEREDFVIFPDAPLSVEIVTVVVRKGREFSVKSLEDLRGMKLGVVQEYVYGEPFDSMTGLNKVRAKSSHQLIRLLLEGRVDAAIGNKAVFRYVAQKKGKLDQLKFVYEVGREPLYLMFSKERGARSVNLARDFGIVVKEMIKDGTFAAIESEY